MHYLQFNSPTIIRSLSNKININLGFEAYMFNNLRFQNNLLFLYQNDKTIVIGRHQNPWKECNIQKIKEDNVQLIRRNSGGGAVYQDLGNHCFTFINEYIDQDPKITNNKILIDTLKQLGISAELSGRNDIHVDGKKVSGSAYQLSLGRKDYLQRVALHHGTMLIDLDNSALGKYLTPSKKKLQSKGVDSVKSRVINLNQIKNITTQDYEQQLIKQFQSHYGQSQQIEMNEEDFLKIEQVKQAADKMISYDWVYGYTPEFTVNLEERFDWGSVDIYFNVINNQIKECKIYSDSLFPDFITQMNDVFLGKQYSQDGIILALSQIDKQYEPYCLNLKEWLLNAI